MKDEKKKVTLFSSFLPLCSPFDGGYVRCRRERPTHMCSRTTYTIYEVHYPVLQKRLRREICSTGGVKRGILALYEIESTVFILCSPLKRRRRKSVGESGSCTRRVGCVSHGGRDVERSAKRGGGGGDWQRQQQEFEVFVIFNHPISLFTLLQPIASRYISVSRDACSKLNENNVSSWDPATWLC